jgi:hypothetical protein
VTRGLATVLVVLSLVGAAACSGDDDGSGGAGAAGAASTTTTTIVVDLAGPPSDASVIGTWTADGTDELATVLDGLDEAPACSGTLTLELGEDGGFTRTLAGTCDFATGEGEVEVVTSGAYATDGGDLVLTDVTGTGTLRGADGEELDLPATGATTGGATGYEVRGDELVLALADAEVVLTRS